MLNWLNGVFCAISNVAHEVPLKSINQGKFTDPFVGFHENMSQIILRLASSAVDCQHVHLVDMTLISGIKLTYWWIFTDYKKASTYTSVWVVWEFKTNTFYITRQSMTLCSNPHTTNFIWCVDQSVFSFDRWSLDQVTLSYGFWLLKSTFPLHLIKHCFEKAKKKKSLSGFWSLWASTLQKNAFSPVH